MSDELDDKRVSAAYAAQREQPPAALDAAILAASRKAVGAGPRVQRPLRRWVPAFAVAATAVLGLALSLQMLVTPQPEAVLQERAKSVAAEAPALAPVTRPSLAVDPVAAPATPAAAPERAAAMLDVATPPAAAAPMAAGSAGGAFEPAPQPAARQQAETEAMATRARDELKAEARESLERVEVTGSRIKRAADDEAAVPAAAAAPAEAPRTLEDLRAELAALRASGDTEAADALERELCAAYPDAEECGE